MLGYQTPWHRCEGWSRAEEGKMSPERPERPESESILANAYSMVIPKRLENRRATWRRIMCELRQARIISVNPRVEPGEHCQRIPACIGIPREAKRLACLSVVPGCQRTLRQSRCGDQQC